MLQLRYWAQFVLFMKIRSLNSGINRTLYETMFDCSPMIIFNSFIKDMLKAIVDEDFGAPRLLHSDNGRELSNKIVGSSSDISHLSFPKSFGFGAATSAFQVEGAWNEDGKGESFFDYIFHTYPAVDNSTADVACDSYHKYREDIELLKKLKVNHYRFSIAWSRVLPTGFLNYINPVGVEYYNKLIDGLLEAGIEPWVTINHFDIPNSINDLGGWNNPNIVDYYTDYADLLFSLYGDRVKTWLTINEPDIFCIIFTSALSVGGSTVPFGVTEYLCSHNIIKAHAKTYRLYRKKYWKKQKGRVALVLNTEYSVPASNSKADIEAAERSNLFKIGLYAHPLVYGNYPQVVIDTVQNYSTIQGFPRSRLPKFTPADTLEIKGAYDFFAVNHYSSVLTTDNRTAVDANPSFRNDVGVITSTDPSWEGSPVVSWLKVYPEGFRQLLNWLKDTYLNPEIVIAEQGYADDGTLTDTARINYYTLYLRAALKAIYEDGVKLTAYTAWGLLDDFELFSGYTAKFGLYYVDFNSLNRTRVAKDSVSFYRKIIETRQLPTEE